MRITRKLARLAPLVACGAVALAMSAQGALATNGIQVVDEATNTACGSISAPHTEGGCAIHASGTITLQSWAFTWVDEAVCIVELELRVSGTGAIAIDDVDLYPGDANCDGGASGPAGPCDLPWEGTGEGISSTAFHATSDVCFTVAETEACSSSLEYGIVEGGSPNAENYAVTFQETKIGELCRINGTLSVEKSGTDSAIHVN